MKASLIAVGLLCTYGTCFAQYPFEKFPALKSTAYHWASSASPKTEDHYVIFGTVTAPAFFKDGGLTIKAAYNEQNEKSYLLLYKGKKLLQKLEQKSISISPMNMPETALVADVNGDGLADVKFLIPSMGNGLAAEIRTVVHLFQEANGHFRQLSYSSYSDDHCKDERDMNGDGNYELIAKTLQSYKSHNYWLFNIYSYRNGALVNVNDQSGYPIMVQYMNKDNYAPAKMEEAVLKKYTRKLPDDYEVIR